MNKVQKTNIDKCRALEADIQTLEESLLARFLADKTVPPFLYANNGNAGVKEWKVERVYCAHEYAYIPTRPRNEDVDRITKIRETIAALTEADPMKVVFSLSIVAERTTSGIPWQRLFDHSYGQYETRELAEEANRKWHEDHDPRPGHFACDYCEKQTPDAQKKCHRIRINYAWEDMEFCSGQCASHRQMGAEG